MAAPAVCFKNSVAECVLYNEGVACWRHINSNCSFRRMSRRRFLQAGAALAAIASPFTRALGGAGAAAAPLKRLGSAEPFDYAQLKGVARTMAATAYKPADAVLPAPIAKLGWDEWQAIRFRDDHSLWGGEGVWFQARFFHLGFTVTKPVRLYSVENGR